MEVKRGNETSYRRIDSNKVIVHYILSAGPSK